VKGTVTARRPSFRGDVAVSWIGADNEQIATAFSQKPRKGADGFC
tara:strand:- start:212 stop:346 length:135 start_codon:yes stop_codon:yes gene_type:complete